MARRRKSGKKGKPNEADETLDMDAEEMDDMDETLDMDAEDTGESDNADETLAMDGEEGEDEKRPSQRPSQMQEIPAPKARSNIYSLMLILSFIFIIISIVLVLIELDDFYEINIF